MEVHMQSITALGLAELTHDELVAVEGGSDACWCSGLASKLGYAIGFALGQLVDALVSPEDDNSFLGK
jgi:hypothetical protein